MDLFGSLLFHMFAVAIFQPVFCNEDTKRECDHDCLRCYPVGCIKCPQYIVFATRQCVEECPKGHSAKWSRLEDYMGQVCINTGHIWGLSGETFAIIVGVGIGAFACLIIITTGIVYVKYKKKKTPLPSFEDCSPERREFLKQLEVFRPHAYTFLDMLNDTRRQIRQLHQRGDTVGIAAYQPVVRDLAKLLMLLNRPPEQIPEAPVDWHRLFAWTEKLLKRYDTLYDSSSAQVAQLVNFLQSPTLSQPRTEPQSQFTTLSTFKPEQSVVGSNRSLQDAVHVFNSRFDSQLTGTLNPSWQFPNYSLVTMGTPNCWNSRRNTELWLEDDFFQLGFRPQDEITTEL